MARKQTFNLEYIPEYDFLLIGIICSHRDYRLCYELNRALNLQLKRQPDLEMIMEKKGSTSVFSRFLFENEDGEEIYLIVNRGTNGYYIPEMKMVDYFVVIKNQARHTEVDQLIPKITGIKNVSSAMLMDPTDLKSAENFLLLEPVIDPRDKKTSLPPVV